MHDNTDSVSARYQLSGLDDAPAVMLSHSLATRLEMWRPQIEFFSQRFRVLAYDTRGHGESPATGGAFSLRDLADDAANLLDALSIDSVHWMGISMGGMVGQALALYHPQRVASLILCDTMADFPAAAADAWRERIEIAGREGLEPLVAPTIERWFSPEFVEHNPDLVDEIRTQIRTTPVAGYVGCSRAIMELSFLSNLPEITQPALVIVGADDQGTPVSASEAMHAVLPDSQLVILPNARHLSNIEQAAAFNKTVLAFLAKQQKR